MNIVYSSFNSKSFAVSYANPSYNMSLIYKVFGHSCPPDQSRVQWKMLYGRTL